jgi:hypothetical protein
MKRSREEAPLHAPVARLERQSGDGGQLDLAADEDVRLRADGTRLYLKAHDAGVGTVYVTTQ